MKTNEDIKNAICDRITQRIEKLGITQTEAAERCGIAPARISEMRHHRVESSIDTLILWASHLGLDLRVEVKP